MKTWLNQSIKQPLIAFIVISGCLTNALANAVSVMADKSTQQIWTEPSRPEPFAEEFRPILQPIRIVDNDHKQKSKHKQRGKHKYKRFRSKSDVVQEVKYHYNARVLKIVLNEKRAVYNVRVLLPSGKIRNIQVSAQH